MDLSPVPKTIQITGITTHIAECLDHPVLIKLIVDGTIVCLFLKKKESHVGTHPFHRPRSLREDSVLSVQVQEKYRALGNDKTLVRINLSLESLWRGRDLGNPDLRTMKYQLQLDADTKQIWVNFVALSSTSQINSGDAVTHFLDETPELNELKYYLLDGIKIVDPRAVECMPGTRTKILADIVTKIGVVDKANIIWVRGAPGSGKSSLSLSAKARLYAQGRLVTYYRFDRNESSTTTPTALWRHVAYELGRRLPSIQLQLLQQIRDDTVDLNSPTAVFTSLIENPLSRLTEPSVDCPLVIVIDGLDECGGLAGHLSPDRQVLLQTLRRWSQLPRHFKLLVTSREEGVFARVLSSISTPIDVISGHFLAENPQHEASIHACNDIRIFLEGRFRRVTERIPSLSRDWPGTPTITRMVGRAAGIFMWATAAMNFIDGRGIDPEGRLRRIMADVSESRGMQPLYSLYNTILETSFGDISDDGSEADILRSVLGTMVLALRPLRDIEYTKLPTTEPVTQEMLDSFRDGLHSVLALGALRFVHKSFDDFLLSKECPPKYAIRLDESQYMLTKLCIMTMTAELRFNMCSLESSLLKNVNIPDIGVKIDDGISTLLSYSCYFFADHLSCTPFDQVLIDKVREVIFDKLLFWFEVMSLLREIRRVSPSLLLVLKWTHPSPDDEFKEFVRDSRQLVEAFGTPMQQSAPHIYISALPFAPERSPVARHFLPQFPNTLSLSTGKLFDWPLCVFTSKHHKEYVNSVAFSPDETHFVSGSKDKTICICDSEIGHPISSSFTGESGILRTFFDLDGQRVWTSDSDGRVIGWDVESGNKHLDFQAQTAIGCTRPNGVQYVICISKEPGAVTLWSSETGERLHDFPIECRIRRVALSPNGCYIAGAGLLDAIPRIWKLVAGSEIQLIQQPSPQPQYTHTKPISALSFSVEGDFVVSGSYDGTILIWDVNTGDVINPPLATDKRRMVDAVAYSHTTRLLLSAWNFLMTTWNPFTHEVVLGPLRGHTSKITTIAMSRDGRRVLTSSEDKTVKKWDLDRKVQDVPVVHPDKDHIGLARYFAFSPCGQRLAVLSYDKTVRILDTNTRKLLLDPITLPYDYLRITFSPDGNRLAAYESRRGHVQLWDMDSGELGCPQDIIRDDKKKITLIDLIAFRSTDDRLVTCSDNGVMRIWSLDNGTMTEDFSVSRPLPVDPNEAVEILALAPDGLTIIVRDYNRGPHLYAWGTMTCQFLPLTLIHEEDEDVSSSSYRIRFSPSGQFVAIASHKESSTLQVWNIATGELVAGLDDKIHCLTFSPDDSHIAFSYSADSGRDDGTTIWIWDICTGHFVSGIWSGYRHRVTQLAYSPDGKILVSGSYDGQVKFWNTADMLADLRVTFRCLGAGTSIKDGWVVDSDGGLRFWVPMDHREKLAVHGNIAVAGGSRDGTPTHVDLTRFKFGENWTECFKGEK